MKALFTKLHRELQEYSDLYVEMHTKYPMY